MEQPAALNLHWRKSTYSSNGGVDCVEAAHMSGAVLVRDTTQDGTGPVLRLNPADWRHLIARLRVPHPTVTLPL